MSQARQLLAGASIHHPKPAAARRAPRGTGMARNAMIVSLAYVASRLLGMLREMILAAHFGTGRDMDAYIVAFRIPDLLFLTIMSGSFGAAFIPVYGSFIDQGQHEKASRLASAIMTWAGVVIAVVAGLVFVFAMPALRIVAPGYDGATYALAVSLMRILLLSPIFFGFAIAAKGMLEAQNQFTLPAMGPIVYNLAIIVGAATLATHFGITAVAWAAIVGAALYLAIELPGLIRARFHFRPTFDRHIEGLGEVASLLGPRVIGLAAFQINFIAVTAFATTLGAGNASAFNYAWQLLMLPHGILALSISTVAFPPLAAAFGRGDTRSFARLLDSTMRPLLFLSIPASVGLTLLGREIITVIYQRGAFDDQSTHLVSLALFWFAVGLVGYALTEIVTRVFYAARDTRTPVATTVVTIILNIVLCGLLVDSTGVRGLTFAMSATTACEAIIMMAFLRQRSGQVFQPGFALWLLKVMVASAVMAGVIILTRPWLDDVLVSPSPVVMHLAYFVVSFATYVLAFGVAAWVLRIHELESTIARITRRLPLRRLLGRA